MSRIGRTERGRYTMSAGRAASIAAHAWHEGLMDENARIRRSAFRAAAVLLCVAASGGAAHADAVSDFYKGKTVSLIAGFPPGGGYDTYVRVLARHYGRFIPGQPSVVASNLPGAGSLNAANQIYNKTAPDGLTLAMFASSAAMEPLLGNKAALFDATKFGWIGSMSNDVAYCGVWQGPGIATSFDEMLTKETIWGGGARAAITFQHPMVLKNVLHAKIKVIPGYAGSRDINLAMQRGEVNGECGLFGSSIKSQFADEVKSGKLKIVIQMGNKRSDEFGKVPSVFDYAKTDDDRAVLDVHFRQLLLGRPLAGPPGIPAERLKALRDALTATMKDPEFLAEANKVGLDIDPASAEAVEDLLKRLAAFPPEVFRKAQEAIGR
jgi:tripartite-type tricarboxylate transporter receptor subunit TctC